MSHSLNIIPDGDMALCVLRDNNTQWHAPCILHVCVDQLNTGRLITLVIRGTLMIIVRRMNPTKRHCDESAECETARQHKVAEVACYRPRERTLMGCNRP